MLKIPNRPAENSFCYVLVARSCQFGVDSFGGTAGVPIIAADGGREEGQESEEL